MDMINDTRMYWFNYRKSEYEYIDTPVDFTDYIPQDPAAIRIYQLLQSMGETPIKAALHVLKVSVGEPSSK